MSRLERFQPSHLDITALKSHESQIAISTLLHLVTSCAGPHGKNHVIRNTCGGHMTITSSSLRLLSSILISRNELKIIVSAILGHVNQFRDGGLLMAFITLRLLKSPVLMEIPHFTVSSLLHAFVSSISSYLASDECNVVVKVDFSNIRVLLAYVKSVLSSKTLLNLKPDDCNRLSLLIVEMFLGAVPSVASVHGNHHSNGMFVVGVENQPVSASKTLDGVLLACPDISNFKETGVLGLKMNTLKNDKCENGSYIKAILITCSMAGDIEEVVQTNFEASNQKFLEVDRAIMQEMIELCDRLAAENVGIVLCQKVIHPRIKVVLKSHGIFCVDRLGSQVIPYMRDLTGCVPLTSVMFDKNGLQECFGCLTSVTHHVEGGRSYLLLSNSNNSASIASLIVCGEWEERVAELKNCVNACLQGLSMLAKQPRFLMGGGCWQMNCADMLEKQFLGNIPKALKELQCSEAELRQVLSVFVASLRGWCRQLKNEEEHLSYNPSSHHSWHVPKGRMGNLCGEEVAHCCCGFKAVPNRHLQDLDVVILDSDSSYQYQKDRENNEFDRYVTDCPSYNSVVLDSFIVSVEALTKACLTVGMLLSIGQFVTDRN